MIRKKGERLRRLGKRSPPSRWLTEAVCLHWGQTVKQGDKKKGGKSFEIHMQKHQVEKFSCFCPGVPKLLPILNLERINIDFRMKEQHMKIVHISWFGCDECEKSFQYVDHLSVHKEKHELAVRCSLCNYLSISKESLMKHSCEPVSCPDCKKIYQSRSNLTAHC